MNDAATGAATFSSSGGITAGSAAQTGATIQYDSKVHSYQLTVKGRSQTFGPGDLDASQSNELVSVYVKKNGKTTDSLTLTKAGESGRFTYKYVGGGFWQRTTVGSTSATGSIDAISYGIATPNAALPRTGRAEYQIDLIGVEAAAGGPIGITGQGTTQIDFASGAVITHGTATTAIAGTGQFSSEAKLSSASNSFTGNFRYDDFGPFFGNIDGRLYGPNAEEIGAAFSASQSDGRVFVGTILGRGDTVTASNDTVVSPTVDDFFANDAAKLNVTLQGQSGTNNNGERFSNGSAGAAPLIVNYDASSGAYTVIGDDRSQYFGTDDVSIGSTSEKLQVTTATKDLDGYAYATLANLKYVASKRWTTITNNQYRIEDFVYGVETPASAMPRTGTASYAVGLSGIVADDDFPNFAYMAGFGALTADFAKGKLTTAGQLRYTEDYYISGRAPERRTGTFSGSATISSKTNAFAGSVNFDGLGDYSGAMNGRFYGPGAEEVGAAFTASDGHGGVAEGTLVGGLDASAVPDNTGLADLTKPTEFTFDEGVDRSSSTQEEVTAVSYDPTSGGYVVTLHDINLDGSPTYKIEMSAATRDAAASDASFDVYRTTVDGEPYTATLLRPVASNPTLALTYTSLAIVEPTTPSPYGFDRDRHYVAFGLATSRYQMPITGSATYTGIARGVGSVETYAFSGGNPAGTTSQYDLAGTFSMVADFANASYTSTIDVTGIDAATHASHHFDPIVGDGTFSGGVLSGLTGRFYGPHAEEVGGIFGYYNVDDAGTLTQMTGAFVGKR